MKWLKPIKTTTTTTTTTTICHKHKIFIIEDGEQEYTSSVPVPVSNSVPVPLKVLNKGTGAGGSNTNYYGKKFEEKTNNELRLLEQDFNKISIQKNKNYLFKTMGNKNITFVTQTVFKKVMKHKYDVSDKYIFRCPDEAYIIENTNTGRKVIKILEKKEQNVEGSVETKLWAGPGLKRDYELNFGENYGFEIEYAFCLSSFLKKKMLSGEQKYITLQTILKESNIHTMYGDDSDYFEKLDDWILR